MANEIQQPKPYDLVGDPIRIGGIGQGFEAKQHRSTRHPVNRARGCVGRPRARPGTD